ncbi:hypothetical protein DSO57_1015322 [Entomophthora muscae]|uniref:Uncharacterized protein n=1 Tax=Entomophthora muscae TaxID=34485 RepID=A0ACC2UEQ6_9FUNG|nr:hypothetical protein DSO57_1015322 [Entomophthora muscae]
MNVSHAIYLKKNNNDPLVSWVAETQKRKFVKTVLPKNITSTFKTPIEDKGKDNASKTDGACNLEHAAILELREEFKKWAEESAGSGSNWVCYFGPPRCGVSFGLRQAGNNIPGVAYISLRQQSTDENFSLFIAKQLQTSELTKLENMEPGDLRDALRAAIKEIVKDGIKPILIIGDCEFGIEKDGFSINEEFSRLLDILMELSEYLAVYLISHDARLVKGLKQVSQIREHLGISDLELCKF